MYIGTPEEKILDRMKKDNIIYNLDEYLYNKELRKMNIDEFVDFCIKLNVNLK